MPAVLSFLGRMGLNLLKRVGFFLLKKIPSLVFSASRSLNQKLQEGERRKRETQAQLQLLQALGFVKKPSFGENLLEKLRGDPPLFFSLVIVVCLFFFLFLAGFLGSILIPASSLITSGP